MRLNWRNPLCQFADVQGSLQKKDFFYAHTAHCPAPDGIAVSCPDDRPRGADGTRGQHATQGLDRSGDGASCLSPVGGEWFGESLLSLQRLFCRREEGGV